MEPIIVVKNLEKIYPKRGKEIIKAVDGVSFEVQPGEIFGLLGPNGAGKTSTMKCICGLLDFENGDIRVNGYSMKKQRNKGLRHISAVLEGNRNIYWRMTVKENLYFFAGINGVSKSAVRQKMNTLLEKFQLQQQQDMVVNNLSRGMKQKVAIVISLITDKEIILLDEPTLGLDVEMSHEMRKILKEIAKEEKKTILLSTHDMNVVEDTCDRLIIINKGKVIAENTVQNLKGLFERQIYHIRIQNPEGTSGIEEAKKAFEEGAVLLDINRQGDEVTITVELRETNELYRILEILRKQGINLISLNRANVNLETIFMDLVKEEI